MESPSGIMYGGICSRPTYNGAGSPAFGWGAVIEPYYTGSDNLYYAGGLYGGMDFYGYTGDVTLSAGLLFSMAKFRGSSSGTMANAYGIQIEGPSWYTATTTITTAYGLVIGNIAHANVGTAYAIHTGTGTNYLGDSLEVVGELKTNNGRVSKTLRLTGAATLDGTSEIIFCNTGAAYTVTVDASPTEGRHYKIINSGTGGHTLKVGRNGNNMFGTAADPELSDGESIDIHYNATDGWY